MTYAEGCGYSSRTRFHGDRSQIFTGKSFYLDEIRVKKKLDGQANFEINDQHLNIYN